MCGIAGFYNAKVEQAQIDATLKKLHHRGPDDRRFYLNGNVGLIHTRLSIIELSELGAQPYRFEDLVLVYNGEIYNYREIREELKTAGYTFLSNSDTEVLIKAFHCWGDKCIDRFIGMFAFCIYNESSDEIFLFRDRVGVKPVYYSYENGVFYFASELQALSVFNLSKEINPEAVSIYFRFGFVPHRFSIYKSISKLEPGHFIRISREGLTKQKYWRVKYEINDQRTENEWLDELEALLISSFRYRMVSDVPVGIFLSGGIDSSLLASILQKHCSGIHTFTIGFAESKFDESSWAKKIASFIGTDHVQKILKLEEARELLSQFYSIYDEPFADTSGIPTACVTKLAKEYGMKVVLSADGGDELFGGYTHYINGLDVFNKFSSIPSDLRKGISKSTRFLIPSSVRENLRFKNISHKAYAFEELMTTGNPVEFYESFIANQSMDEISRMMPSAPSGTMNFLQTGSSPLQNMMAWDFQYYLPDDLLVKVDRATMHYGLECREPFLDHRLVEFAAQIPIGLKIKDGEGKYLLRKLLSRYLPEAYFVRKKQGFSIPIFEWFKKDLDSLFNEYFSNHKLSEIPFFNGQEIQREFKKYLHYRNMGKQYNIEKMWRILSFMLWWEKYMKNGA